MFQSVKCKGVLLALAGVLSIGLLSACGSGNEGSAAEPSQAAQSAAPSAEASPAAADTASTRTVTDELGHEITIPVNPQRVYAPYLEDSLLKLGVTPVAQWASGSWVQEYLQDQLKDVPKLDFNAGTLPAPEAVMSVDPDLIILHTSNYAQNGVYEKYSQIAPTYVFKGASSDVEKSLATLGDLLGKSSEAEQAIADYKTKVEEAKAKLGDISGKKVAIIRFNPREGINLMGGNYLCGLVVHQVLGLGKSKLVETENSASLSLEALPDLDADYLFLLNPTGVGTELLEQTMADPIWQTIPAVKAGRAFEVDNRYWLGSGLTAYEKIIDDTVTMLQK